jgi:hypothetical protein
LPAKEFYAPKSENNDPVDLTKLLKNFLWNHALGRSLLKSMLSLGIALHSISGQTNEAIKIFVEMLELDFDDNLV